MRVPLEGKTLEEGPWERCRVTGSGDCAAANAGWAIDSPVCGHGACFRCTGGKGIWLDEGELKRSAVPRNFVLQCVTNHRNPFKLLPGRDNKGKFYSEYPAPICPCCGVVVDDALEAKEKLEEESADPVGQNDLRLQHSKTHWAGLRGKIPVMPMDHRCRSRGLLHRRMNIVSNQLAATFLKVTFNARKRRLANALLERRKMMWRFPETKKKRAKTISAGNDARRLLSDSELLVGLFAIFYEETTSVINELRVESLASAADGNDNVRNEMPALVDAKVPEGTARKSAKGASGGVAKKAATKSAKKKSVMPVLSVKGKQVTEKEVAKYAKDRTKATAAGPKLGPVAPAPAPKTPANDADAASAARAAASPKSDVEVTDSSVEIEDDEMDELEEDEEVGGVATALKSWRTAIQYTSDIHAPITNHFDMTERKAHAEKCAASGKAWALAINDHTSNRASWQYVHDAFYHIYEDIMEHGAGDRNDDAILEKANRRKKRLGDRCTMRGGKNHSWWDRTIRVLEKIDGKKTGKYVKKTVSVVRNIGQAAQVQRLDMVAQICQAYRKSASELHH